MNHFNTLVLCNRGTRLESARNKLIHAHIGLNIIDNAYGGTISFILNLSMASKIIVLVNIVGIEDDIQKQKPILKAINKELKKLKV